MRAQHGKLLVIEIVTISTFKRTDGNGTHVQGRADAVTCNTRKHNLS